MRKNSLALSVAIHALLLAGLVSHVAPVSIPGSLLQIEFKETDRQVATEPTSQRSYEKHFKKATTPIEVKAVASAAVPPSTQSNGNTTLAIDNHGPQAIFSPMPRMPEVHLDEDIKTSVVIEFAISADSSIHARLISSSGYDDLDEVAMGTARQWRFQPAVVGNRPIDSTLRLRVNFIVD